MTEPPRPDAFLAACPSRTVLARLGDKWTLLVLARLASAPSRFGQLRRAVDGVTQKMLTQTLRHLERDGLVARTVISTRPLQVDYALTPAGRELSRLVRPLKAWAERHLHDVTASNSRFDRARDAEARRGRGAP